MKNKRIYTVFILIFIITCTITTSTFTEQVQGEGGHLNAGTVSTTATDGVDAGSVMEAVAANENVQPGMELAAENDFLELFIDKTTTVAAVKDKKSGKIWYTNPPAWEDDTMAGSSKSKLMTQFTITYANNNGAITVIDNYEQSILKGQYVIEPLKNGVKVVYTLGNVKKGIEDIPKKLSNERFKSKLLDRVDGNEQKELKRRFSYIKEENTWVRREINTPQAVEKLIQIVDKAGYTKDDLIKDTLDNGIPLEGIEKKFFVIPIEYTLDQEHLVARIPVSEIKYPKEYPIVKMDVLELFGAGHHEQSGYIFVPDGSGAVIHLGLADKGANRFNAPVYGEDRTMFSGEKRNENENILLPVYGMKQGDQAWFAIIEEGDALASIQAYKAGMQNSYNSVFSTFDLTKMEFITLGNTMNSGYPAFQKKLYNGDIQLRYTFLRGDEANYSGMARCYQNYLIEKYKMNMQKLQQDIPFFVETIGAIKKVKSFMGIRYKGLDALTTYEENIEILQELQKADIHNIQLKVSGWFNEGMNQKFPTDIKLEKVLGGSKGFNQLVKYAKDANIGLYPDVSFLTFDSHASGFTRRRYVAETLEGKAAKEYKYNAATFGVDGRKDEYFRFILSPSQLPYVVHSFTNQYKKYNVNGISLRDIGDRIYSDFNEKKTVDRQDALKTVEEQLNKIKTDIGSILVNKGNAATVPYADFVLNVPQEHSWYMIEDERVPFYQMVFHGFVGYAGSPINLSSDHKKDFLRAIEVGSSIYFQWIYDDASATKATDFDYMYSSNYKGWLDAAIAYYQKANAVLREVQNQKMVGHSKIGDDVYKTDYEKGISVIVNYNKEPVTANGIYVEAEGYKIVRGGNGE